MEAKTFIRNLIFSHRKIQAKINKAAKTKKQKIMFIKSLPYNLNEKCQYDLDILANYTERSKIPEYFDNAKNIVFKTLGYCVGENL